MTMKLTSKEIVNQVSQEIAEKVSIWKEKGIQPTMSTILVQGDPASAYYAKAKEKLAHKLGVAFRLISFEMDVTEERLLLEIEALNTDPDVHGIMLELPVPGHISVQKLSDAINPTKDVDGISSVNKLACMTGAKGLYPATPQSCIRILKHYGFQLQGANVVLVGRGETVGRPLMQLLLRENATLTVCHSYTDELVTPIAQAQILISAVGRANLITPEMVHSDLVIVDAGINETEKRIVGDVNPEVSQFVKAMTPVPGGVGSLTTVILFENLLKAIELQAVDRASSSRTFDQTIHQFLVEASSKSPTPGGGSIAALAAGLGTSMGSMVANLTSGPRFAEYEEKMIAIVENMKLSVHDFENILEQDIEAFKQYMKALGMPKGSTEEKELRSEALQAAAALAAEVPLGLMRRCNEVMMILQEVVQEVNKNVISDLGIAIIMLEAASQSAWITVQINVQGIKNTDLRNNIQAAGEELTRTAQEIKRIVLQSIMNRIS
jgi:methylenetetrahydrofolate dehydrogenase (NADP+)/methenyltetrahydrofolate cyclohydrolase